jgi:SAM-dependent methyltransferase
MTIASMVHRNMSPRPWAEGDKIPWNEPGFSRRMLDEHLSQAHDMASRRSPTIDRQAEWIHERVFQGKPRKILDLGCGPGLYADRFITRGHVYTGIDFSPASIAYARKSSGAGASFIEGDIRTVGFGHGHTAVMSIYGELNVFTKADAELILAKAGATLEEGGILVVEAHTFDCVKRIGMASPAWRAAERGVFSDGPYIQMTESFWCEEDAVAIQRFYVLEEGGAEAAFYTQSIQAYTDASYTALVEKAGFTGIELHPSLTGAPRGDGNLFVMTARKGGL